MICIFLVGAAFLPGSIEDGEASLPPGEREQLIDDDYEAAADSLRRGMGSIAFIRRAASRVPVWKEAAEAGDPKGMYLYARCLEEGIGVDRDLKAAFRLQERSAEAGCPAAMNNLGVMYRLGRAVEEDPGRSARWLERAAGAGFGPGVSNLAFAYELGHAGPKGMPRQAGLRAAAELHRKAARDGCALSIARLAELYRAGEAGMPRNPAAAAGLFRQAAELGHPRSQTLLGAMYFGESAVADLTPEVEADPEEGARWCMRAARSGDPVAMTNAGACYEFGLGVPKNPERAVPWYRLAAEAGHPRAMGRLGRCYEQGNGVTQDPRAALEWYRKGAEKGDDASREALARLGG